jgi:hypothetical protein
MLRVKGWKGSGQDYKYASGLYRASINFQKNRYNTKDEVEFTVNLAVWNDGARDEFNTAHKLALENWGRDAIVIPTWGTWHARIGHLLPIQADKWWRLLTGRSPERTTTEILSAFSNFALPALTKQMEKPRIEPAFVIERRGSRSGERIMSNGDRSFNNVGGERLYPVDDLIDVVDHEGIFRTGTSAPNIPIELQAIRPNEWPVGWLPLEIEPVRRHLAAERIRLTDDLKLSFSLWWVDPEGHRHSYWLSGEARSDDEWGWGAEVSPRSLREYLEAAEKQGYRPDPPHI